MTIMIFKHLMFVLAFFSVLMSIAANPLEEAGDIQGIVNHENIHFISQEGYCGRTSWEKKNDYEQSPSISPRILGGINTLNNEFPWIAQLTRHNYIGLFCGGSLINKRYVLTAAHCLYDKEDDKEEEVQLLSVRLGAHYIRNECASSSCGSLHQFGVEEIILHPNYDKNTTANDIALIRLTNDVDFIEGVISPVCLPTDCKSIDSNIYGKPLIIAGFGRNDSLYCMSKNNDSLELYPESLQKFQVAVTLEECESFIQWDPATEICVREPQITGICKGDSGSPLMYKDPLKGAYYQLGIVSHKHNRDEPNLYLKSKFEFSIYSRVSHFMPWILDQMRD